MKDRGQLEIYTCAVWAAAMSEFPYNNNMMTWDEMDSTSSKGTSGN